MVAKAALAKASSFSGSLSVAFLLAAVVTSHAQAPPPAPPSPPPPQAAQQPKPVTGFVSSYEILRTVRSAGFDPLSPPLREGTTYVLRATDFRGIPMRVVLDARTGFIRDVTRIVSGAPGPYGMMAPPYGPAAYAAEFATPDPPAGLPSPQLPMAPAITRPAAAARLLSFPPLPRPRPAAVASQASEKAGKVQEPAPPARSANLQPQTGASANAVGVNGGAAPATSAAPNKLPPLPPFND